jgi:hypothetical protein
LRPITNHHPVFSKKGALARMTAQADILFERELWETAVTLRGTVAPADYKHYVLPLLFLRYLSLRYEQRKAELVRLIKEPSSEYYTGDRDINAEILADQSEYEKQNIYVIPEKPVGRRFVATPAPVTSSSALTTPCGRWKKPIQRSWAACCRASTLGAT